MKRFTLSIVILCSIGIAAAAQTTEFTYQGILNVGTPPTLTTVNYDFEFGLFSIDTGGSAIATIQRLNVPVANGAFTVKLDFGSPTLCPTCFDGSPRWLEIAVRPAGSGGFQILLPRQAISSTPYSITASNALKLGGTAANQYLLTNGNGSALTNLNAGNISTGTLAIANGGTGSATKNFVDLSSDQPGIGGNKTFTGNLTVQSNNPVTGALDVGSRSRFRQNTGSIDTTNSAGFWLYQNVPAADRAFIGMERDNIVGIFGNNGGGWGLAMNTQTGNVGIGTTIPQQRLSVSDGMNIDQNNLNIGTLTNTMRFGPGNSGEAIGSKRTTGGNQFGLDFYTASSNRLSITAAGNVGIGTTNPASKLQVFGAGSVRVTADSDSNAGIGLSLNNQTKWSVATVSPGQFQIYNQVLNSNAVWIDPTTNNVGIGSTSPAATLDVNGYTKLGSDAPSIRVKKLTGTTAANEGGIADIPHGLDPSKILSISVMVNCGLNCWVGPESNYFSDTRFSWGVINNFIKIYNIFGGSASILSKPIKILITYEQ